MFFCFTRRRRCACSRARRASPACSNCRKSGDGPTKIVGSITGLPGKHGLHVHEFGDTTNGCMSTGPHFNPNNMDHGAPTDKIRHAGDLGNVEATAGGCDFTIEDMQIPLSGANSIIGRAFVIHELEDDLGRGDSSENRHAR